MKQISNNNKIELELNIAEFLAEYFGGKSGFSYGPFWQAISDGAISIYTDRKPENDSSFYYEYGLLKAEEEMEAEHIITETYQDDVWRYNIHYINAEEPQVSYFFYTKTRIMIFSQYENSVLEEVAWEMQEIIKQKPVLCLESGERLFRQAVGEILDAVRDNYYGKEELQSEYCPSNTEVADWMQYKYRCSRNSEACGYAIGNNVGNAIDAAWTWIRTGYINNFISVDTKTKRISLNW